MVLITRCCCWNSVRRGSFASGIFTLAVHLVMLTTTVFHINSVSDSPELLTLGIFLLMSSFFTVVSSVVLFVALCVDNRLLLLPWIVSVSLSTLLNFGLSFYLIPDMIENPIVGSLFATDMMFCLLNVYCIICVISQYQQYLAGRGRAGQRANSQPIPTVRLQPDVSHSKNVPSVSYQVARNGSPSAGLLAVPSPNSSSMTSKSPLPTDMSSISEDPSSNDASRKLSTSDTSADESSQKYQVTSKSFFLSPFLGKNTNEDNLRNTAKEETPESSSQQDDTSTTDIVIKVDSCDPERQSLLKRFRF